MDLVVYVAEWMKAVLGWTLLLAGLAKAWQPMPQRFFPALGVPPGLRGAAWKVLAGTELVLAVGLLAGDPTPMTSWASGLLFTAFFLYSAVLVFQGAEDHCACFGDLLPEPWGWPVVIRNAVLGGGAWMAGVLSVYGMHGPPRSAISLGEVAAVLVLGVVTVALYVIVRLAIALYRVSPHHQRWRRALGARGPLAVAESR